MLYRWQKKNTAGNIDARVRNRYVLSITNRNHPLLSFLRNRFIALIVVTSLIAFTFYSQKWWHQNSSNTIVVLYLKVLDANNIPVAQTEVRHNNKTIGITDNFGQWNQQLRTQKGSKYILRFKKKTLDNYLSAVKNIVIPMSTTHVQKIHETIILRESKYFKAYNQQMVKINNSVIVPKNISISPYRQIAFNFSDTKKNKSKQNRNELEKKLLSMLNMYASNLGLVVTQKSRWQVLIEQLSFAPHLNYSHHTKLLRIVANNHYATKKTDFLQPYYVNDNMVAKKILMSLTRHTKKDFIAYYDQNRWYITKTLYSNKMWPYHLKYISENGNIFFVNKLFNNILVASANPCGNYAACKVYTTGISNYYTKNSYKKYSLYIKSNIGKNTSVFVGGFKAQQQQHPQHYTYWSKGTLPVYVTAISNYQVILRYKIIPQNHNSLRIATNRI